LQSFGLSGQMTANEVTELTDHAIVHDRCDANATSEMGHSRLPETGGGFRDVRCAPESGEMQNPKVRLWPR
jgi:hypothetical protein